MSDPTHQPVGPEEPRADAPAAAPAAVAAEQGDPNPPSPLSGTKGKQRASDRLNISSAIVRNAGFAPGEKAFVADEDPAGATAKPCLVLLKQPPPKVVADYVVAKGHRIRVTPATLKKCGLEGRNFEIVGGDGKIIVRAV